MTSATPPKLSENEPESDLTPLDSSRSVSSYDYSSIDVIIDDSYYDSDSFGQNNADGR